MTAPTDKIAQFAGQLNLFAGQDMYSIAYSGVD